VLVTGNVELKRLLKYEYKGLMMVLNLLGEADAMVSQYME
jgi:hypothetical protein